MSGNLTKSSVPLSQETILQIATDRNPRVKVPVGTLHPIPPKRAVEAFGPYKAAICAAAQKYKVPAAVLAGLLWTESQYNPRAKSSAGAEGIAQFEPPTAAAYQVDPWDPGSAIPGAAKLLADLCKQLGRWEYAIAGYNWGGGRVTDVIKGKRWLPPETYWYVLNVLNAAAFFSKEV